MASPFCLRCLRRSLPAAEGRPVPRAFSTTASLSANPPKKKPVTGKPVQKAGKTLRLAKTRRVETSRPPAPGERKAARKRVVLSNGNALDVADLPNWTSENVGRAEALRALEGQVVGIGPDSVDALRALEAFKANQGWHHFRRPATVVRRETVELGEALLGVKDEKRVVRQLVHGGKGTGKSVLVLQGLAMAYLQGMVVVLFPEARDMTDGRTAYEALPTPSGETLWVQPEYTAQLLRNIATANKGLLDNLQASLQHSLPVPVQDNISLFRLAEMGASDPAIAYPVWQALWKELLAPSQPDKHGRLRPPVAVAMDGVDHIMRVSAYLDADAQPIHAHDLAVARDFTALLSGKTPMPNGGAVLAATSASTRPSVPTLDHIIDIEEARPHLERLLKLKADLLKASRDAKSLQDIDMTPVEDLRPRTFPPSLERMAAYVQSAVLRLHDQDASPQALHATIERSMRPRLPEWNPYEPRDSKVEAAMQGVRVRRVAGLGMAEARSVMEYYAKSGMVRAAVTEGLVREKWAVAGGGVVGEIEKGSVGMRF